MLLIVGGMRERGGEVSRSLLALATHMYNAAYSNAECFQKSHLYVKINIQKSLVFVRGNLVVRQVRILVGRLAESPFYEGFFATDFC